MTIPEIKRLLEAADTPTNDLLNKLYALCRERKTSPEAVIASFKPMLRSAWEAAIRAYPYAEPAADSSRWFPQDQPSKDYQAQVVELVASSHYLALDGSEFHLYPIEDPDKMLVGPGVGLNTPTNTVLGIIGARWRETLGAEAHKISHPKFVRQILETFLVLAGDCSDAVPALYVQPEDRQWAFARRTIDADATVPMPNIARLLAAMNDPEAFAAKLFAIAYGLDTSRQALYVRGEGKDGKSSFLKAFVRILGERVTKAITGVHVSQSSKFLAAEYKDCALVYSPDNQNPAILLTEVVKSITGDDKVSYEKKYGGFGEYASRAKLIIFSNQRPMVLNERHSLSRILYLEMTKPVYEDVGVEAFSEACWAEMPGFLAYGAECYAKRWANNMIELNEEAQTALENLVADTSFDWDVFAGKNLTFEEGAELEAHDFSAMLDQLKLSKIDRSDYRKKLQNDPRVSFAPISATDRRRIYRGVRRRVASDLLAVGDLANA